MSIYLYLQLQGCRIPYDRRDTIDTDQDEKHGNPDIPLGTGQFSTTD